MRSHFLFLGIIGISCLACGGGDEPNIASSASSGTSAGGASGTGGAGGTGGNGGTGGTGGAGGMGGMGGAGGAGGMGGGASEVTFERITVDATNAQGAAWITARDMNGDQKIDLVLSRFGALGGVSIPDGEVAIYTQGATIQSWTRSTVVPPSQGIKFPNHTTVDDLDGDGDLDIIVASGFLVCTAIPGSPPCGALFWMEKTAAGYTPHSIVPNGASLFYHQAVLVDFDGDGVRDIVTVGEAQGMFGGAGTAVTEWYKGDGSADRFEKQARKIGDGLGSLPTVLDVDGDGDLDVASAEYFYAGASFAWMERTADPSPANPTGTFVRHVINADSGPSIMLGFVPNLYGDGKTGAVGSNHTNTAKIPPDAQESAILFLDPPADPKQPWAKTILSQGIVSVAGSVFSPQAAPGIFGWGDIDGDGDVDLAVSGDGDPHVYWMEQLPGRTWAMHVLEDKLAQAGGMVVADLDGDGKNEIVVTGYEANAVYVYVRK